MLKQHFSTDHFLCLEGDCQNERFTNAFRSELDLKAHRLDRHSGALSKSETRQNRRVDIEVSFKRQPASHQERRRNVEASAPAPSPENTSAAKVPDLSQDFPTLLGDTASPAPQSSVGTAPSGSHNMANRVALSSGKNIPSSSGRSSTWATGVSHSLKDGDFPSLPGASSAPPRPAMPVKSYRPSASAFSTAANKKQENGKRTSEDFPSLTPAHHSMPTFGNPRSSRGQATAWGQTRPPDPLAAPSYNGKEPKAKKGGKKAAPAPDVDFPGLGSPALSMDTGRKGKKSSMKSKEIPSKVSSDDVKANLRSAADLIFSSEKKSNGVSSGNQTTKFAAAAVSVPKSIEAAVSVPKSVEPLVGKSAVKKGRPPPPGFGKKPLTSYRYIEPPNFNQRNARLQSIAAQVFGGGKSLEFSSFKQSSIAFKKGQIKSKDYIAACRDLLSDPVRLEEIVPELIILLPDIDLQNVRLILTYIEECF